MSRHAAPTPQPLAWLTPPRRRWLYTTLLALIAVLQVYGLLDGQTAPAWAALAAALLLGGTALAHTPREGS